MAAHVVIKSRVAAFNVLFQFKNASHVLKFINNSNTLCVGNLRSLSLLHQTTREIFSKEKANAIQRANACRIYTRSDSRQDDIKQDPVVPGIGETFSFSTAKYIITEREYKILNQGFQDYKILNIIMNKSHALIRIPKTYTGDIGLMIGGSPDQIQMAKKLIDQQLSRSMKGEHFRSSASGGDGKLLWHGYVRNYKGQIPPKKTRRKCIRGQYIGTGNPCPVCKFFIEDKGHNKLAKVDYKDVNLLQQFISPQSGKVIDYKITGVCQRRQKELIDAVEKAKDYGLIPFTVPGPRHIPKPFKFAGIPYKVRHKT